MAKMAKSADLGLQLCMARQRESARAAGRRLGEHLTPSRKVDGIWPWFAPLLSHNITPELDSLSPFIEEKYCHY